MELPLDLRCAVQCVSVDDFHCDMGFLTDIVVGIAPCFATVCGEDRKHAVLE